MKSVNHANELAVKKSLVEIPIPTADGNFVAHYSAMGLAELGWPEKAARVVSSNPKLPLQILRWHRATAAALKNRLAGRAEKKLPPFDWSGKTEFQQAVWLEMLKIPGGQSRSYGEVAARIGHPKAVRAVGGACGANPVPVLVPCHRVVAANQKPGGFSGGLEWKRTLLAREGVVV